MDWMDPHDSDGGDSMDGWVDPHDDNYGRRTSPTILEPAGEPWGWNIFGTPRFDGWTATV